jgi:hypothetical protein
VECGARMRKTGYGRSDTRASACSISLRVSPASTDGEHEVPHPSSLDADGAAPSRLANDDPDGRVRHPPRLSVPLSSRPLARLQQADAVRADCNSERSTDPGHRHHGMSSAVGETRRMKAGLCWLDKNEGKYSLSTSASLAEQRADRVFYSVPRVHHRWWCKRRDVGFVGGEEVVFYPCRCSGCCQLRAYRFQQ